LPPILSLASGDKHIYIFQQKRQPAGRYACYFQ
jgi:hypothetical protein